MGEDPLTDDTLAQEDTASESPTGRRCSETPTHGGVPASEGVPMAGGVPSWIALPVGRAETGPSIAELVEAVRAAGGMVGGDALFDPRYEAEMRRFLIRALEMEGIPVPKGGDTP
jgi:hypothetical protein